MELKFDGPSLGEILTDALEAERAKQAKPKPRKRWLAQALDNLTRAEAAALIRDLDF